MCQLFGWRLLLNGVLFYFLLLSHYFTPRHFMLSDGLLYLPPQLYLLPNLLGFKNLKAQLSLLSSITSLIAGDVMPVIGASYCIASRRLAAPLCVLSVRWSRRPSVDSAGIVGTSATVGAALDRIHGCGFSRYVFHAFLWHDGRDVLCASVGYLHLLAVSSPDSPELGFVSFYVHLTGRHSFGHQCRMHL